jgi:hypothetical protein
MKNFTNALFLLFSVITALSQNYIGHSVDNYSGIHGVMFNPANIVESPFKADINLGSASAFFGSDYISLSISDAFNDGFDFDDDAEIFPTDANNFFTNVEIMGPSFMFNLSPKSSIGLISRVRTYYHVNDINGELFESLTNNFDTDADFDFDTSNLSLNLHAWAEIGLAYGRVLIAKEKHMLKAGGTLKYLMGAGSAYAATPGFQGTYSANSEIISSQGELTYGTTQDFQVDDIEYDNLTAGFGLDLGMVYQYHPNRQGDSLRYYQDPYKLKLAVSITDIGSINYEGAELTTYDMNNTVSTANYDDDVEEFLDENYSNTTETTDASIELPTALHFLLDYRFGKKFLISAQANLALTSSGNQFGSRIINTLVIAPRLETKWFSLYAPVSFREYGDVAFGTGLRFGPLSIGSGSLLSNLLSDESKTTDVFVGLKIPLFRK